MKTTLALAASLGLALTSHAGKIPDWWSAPTTSILVPGAAENNYAPLTLGQLKYTAFRAKAYLDANLPGGAGSAVNALVASFSTTGNLKPANIGQLKAVALPFYDRLIAAGFFTKINLVAHGYPSNWAYNYPWNDASPVAVIENYRPANIGQLKIIFSFDVADADADWLPDSYESSVTGQSGQNGSWLSILNGDGVADADGDGISDLAEYQINWNPLTNDQNNATKTETLGYDNAHRLRTVTGRSTLGYTTLDAAGNLTQTTP